MRKYSFLLIILVMFFLSAANYSRAESLSCSFSRSLTIGLRGVDVTCLQLYLQEQGFFNYSGGATSYFGPITRSAVVQWQTANGVTPAWGYFGPLSQVKYKEFISVKTQPKSENPSLSLLLPIIKDEEIIIDSGGISTAQDYIQYFLSNSSQISFDGKKFDSVLKDENGIFLLTPALAGKAVKSGFSQEIKDSLLTQKDFIEAKIIFLKSIKVSGKTVSLHKKMLGFDKLTLELIQKSLNLENDKISKTELNNYLSQYLALSELERNKFLKEAGLAAKEPSQFRKLISWLGLEDKFYAWAASLPPFGGQISEPIPCLCNLGMLIFVGPPTPPISGSLFVPYAFLASPLFYLYESLRPGAWWLGLYNPALIPCLTPPPFCPPIGIGNLIYMTGTSY